VNFQFVILMTVPSAELTELHNPPPDWRIEMTLSKEIGGYPAIIRKAWSRIICLLVQKPPQKA